MRLVDAEVLRPNLEAIQDAERQIYGRESWNFSGKCLNELDNAPTVEERKEVEWEIFMDESLGWEIYRCPVCKSEEYSNYWNYCPFCGSKIGWNRG